MARRSGISASLMLVCMTTVCCSCKKQASVPRRTIAVPRATTTTGGSGSGTIRFLTYNVLADPVFLEQRIPPLLTILEQSRADVIALQEVAPWFLSRLMAEKWVRGYHVTRFDGRVLAPGGQLILSKHTIQKSSYYLLPGKQRRTVVIAEVVIHDKTAVTIATAHMESPLEDGPIRALQLDRVFSLLSSSQNAVFLGDFNFGDNEEPDTSHLDRRYVDLWLAVHPGDSGFTWNMEESAMAREGAFEGEKSRRLDRILVRVKGYVARQARIVGDSPVSAASKEVFPSDHFGLFGEIAAAGSEQ